MKILVTGYKGFIGGHMYRSLLEQGHQVVGYDWGDDLPATNEFDWVIHIGGISSTTERNVEKIMQQNYDFSCQLLDRCMSTGTHFQYSSSASVYGLNTEFREDSPVDPRTPYAWSKYMFERYALKHQEWADHMGYRIQGFRYFNVYGPEGEEHKGSQASPHYKFKHQAELTNYVTVFEGSEKYLRDFIKVTDVVNIQQKFLDKKASGIYNLGSGKAQSFLDVAKMYTSNIIEVPMPEVLKSSYQEYTCADMSKTNGML